MAFGNLLAGVGTLVGALRGGRSGSATNEQQETASTADVNTVAKESLKQNQSSRTSSTGKTKTSTRERVLSQVDGRTTDQTTGNVATTDTTQGSTATQGATTSLGFDARVMSELNSLLMSATGNAGISGTQVSLAERMSQIADRGAGTNFDPVAFADAIAGQASTRLQGDVESKINSLQSAIGASEAGNSMARLLGSRIRNDAASELAGIAADARARGEQLRAGLDESVTSQLTSLAQSSGGLLTSLIGSLAGAQSTTQSNERTNMAQTAAGTQASTTSSVGTNRESTDNRTSGTVVGSATNRESTNSKMNQSSTAKTTTLQKMLEEMDSQRKQKGDTGNSLLDQLNAMFVDSAANA